MDLLGGLANLKVDNVLSAVDKYVPGAKNNIKNLADKAKAYVNNVTELEMKVLEATNHEPWGPHGSAMQDITQSAFHSEGFYQIMGVVDQRLAEGAENWRLVYKALLLLEYMCKHGPMSVVEAVASYSRLSHLERLRDRFEYKDPTGRDQGINVRQRAGALVSLVQDRDKLAEERDKAAKNRAKYTGTSSGASRYGGFAGGAAAGGGGFGSSSSSISMGYSGYGGSSSSSAYDHHEQPGSRYGGSGAAAAAGVPAAAGSAAADGAVDPMEATRRRIERLKQDGALAGGGGSGDGHDGSLGGGADGEAAGRKPKRLADVKINPAISAAFGGGTLGSLAAPPAGGGGGRAAAGGGGGVVDLLGDLDVTPAAAAPSSSSGGAAAAAASGGLDDGWDGFAAAPAAAAADDWGAFDAAPPAAKPGAKQAVDVNALLGPIPSSGPASSGGKAPLPLDDFCSMPAAPPAAPVPAAAAQPAAAAVGDDPFGPFVAPGAAGGDPFAASGAVGIAPAAPKAPTPPSGPKLGPDTAKAKDPFADLAFL